MYKSLEICTKPATTKITKTMTHKLGSGGKKTKLFYYCAEHAAKIQEYNASFIGVSVDKVESLLLDF